MSSLLYYNTIYCTTFLHSYILLSRLYRLRHAYSWKTCCAKRKLFLFLVVIQFSSGCCLLLRVAVLKYGTQVPNMAAVSGTLWHGSWLLSGAHCASVLAGRGGGTHHGATSFGAPNPQGPGWSPTRRVDAVYSVQRISLSAY